MFILFVSRNSELPFVRYRWFLSMHAWFLSWLAAWLPIHLQHINILHRLHENHMWHGYSLPVHDVQGELISEAALASRNGIILQVCLGGLCVCNCWNNSLLCCFFVVNPWNLTILLLSWPFISSYETSLANVMQWTVCPTLSQRNPAQAWGAWDIMKLLGSLCLRLPGLASPAMVLAVLVGNLCSCYAVAN
jgi:hypothetical protein